MDEEHKQIAYRDARFTQQYDQIWQNVNKCVFCDLKEKYILFEEDGIVLTITLFAYIDGHCMIVPRRHVQSPNELTQVEWQAVRKCLYIARKMIKSEYGTKGFQLVQKEGEKAQSTVGHLHFHCIPFDAPDLSVWNYRQLQFTPLENAHKYQAERRRLIEYAVKFDKKYQQATQLPVRLVVTVPNTPEPFVIEHSGSSFEEAIRQHLPAELATATIQLTGSEVVSVPVEKQVKALHARYTEPVSYVQNTYEVIIHG